MKDKVSDLMDRIHVGENVASILLTLSGGDVDMVEYASVNARGLDQCKAAIIDARFRLIEEDLYDECDLD